MSRWIALFSQTGSEIVGISKDLNRWPDIILTNNLDDTAWNSSIHHAPQVIKLKHADLVDYMLNNCTREDKITLHGYLRILPKEVCDALEIYNGHPAPIDIYSELKGKDPQERMWKGNYDVIGSVVHRVVPEVDEGPIITAVHRANTCTTESDFMYCVKQCSHDAWLKFLRGYL